MLPSSRPPKWVEEEKAARLAEYQKLLEQQRRDALKVRVSKVHIFRGEMVEWYKTLRRREKKRLTGKQLKRKALALCHKYNMIYENLPEDWVYVLQTQHNMKLYQKPNKKVETSAEKPVVEPIVRHNPREKRQVQKRVPFQYNALKLSQTTSAPSGLGDGDAVNGPVVEEKQVPVFERNVNKKKWLDYTNDPPPPAWTKMYAEGTVLPRVLTVYSRYDANLVFYDYNPKLQDSEGNKVELTPQPRLNTDYFDALLNPKFNPKKRKHPTFQMKKTYPKPKYPVVYED